MPPTRAWGLTRQNYNVMNHPELWTTLRNELAIDPAYSGGVPSLEFMISLMVVFLQQLDDHLTAEGK